MSNKLPQSCPRCDSGNTIYIHDVEVRVCRDCGLDYWWSSDDDEIVTSE